MFEGDNPATSAEVTGIAIISPEREEGNEQRKPRNSRRQTPPSTKLAATTR